MDYILKGNPGTINRIIRENSIRVRRGEVTFIPVAEPDSNPLATDSKYAAKSIDRKRPRKTKKSE